MEPGVTVETRSTDWRAVRIGVLSQAVVTLALFGLQAPYEWYALGPLLCGLVAGATSENYQNGWSEGMIAAPLGSVVMFVIVVLGMWVTDSPVIGFPSMLLEVVFLGGLVIFSGPFIVFGGALTARFASKFRKTVT